MKSVSMKNFKADPDKYIAEVLEAGEIYGIKSPNGVLVMMEESEYYALREAMARQIMGATNSNQ